MARAQVPETAAEKAWDTVYQEGCTDTLNRLRGTMNRAAAALKFFQRRGNEFFNKVEKSSCVAAHPAEFKRLLKAKQTMNEVLEETLQDLQ